MSKKPQNILELFKEQLRNQVSNIAKDLSLLSEGQALGYWYFTNVKKMTQTEAKEQICDGGGDLGIDAVEIQDDVVLFYQFKNPSDISKGIKTEEVDKLISGLELILGRNHGKIANPELKQRLEEIYSFTPNGYKIILVTSGLSEIAGEASAKLNSFCERNSGAARDLFQWEYHSLHNLHDQFYVRHIPTLDGTVDIDLSRQPYMTKIGDHETYMFDLSGSFLADLYIKHGEQLLQQNVRMFEGENGTNLAILESATSESESKNFFHYNNGVSIICDSATFQPFTNRLTLDRPQVVNGGQTVRILSKAKTQGSLRVDVHVSVRVITTGKDKDFASNVAVNLNNQTRVDNTFLRSNDPRIVQLLHSLASLGYFLERRAGEIEALDPEEIDTLEKKFSSPLNNKVIPLKDGMQAFTATFYGDPQLAKKDPAKIFTDTDGGMFSKIISEVTAEKFLQAYRLMSAVEFQVERFKRLKRKRYDTDQERYKSYATEIGSNYNSLFPEFDASIPQITVFAAGCIYEKFVNFLKYDSKKVVESINKDSGLIWNVFFELVGTRNNLTSIHNASWPTLLKSGGYFRDAVAFLKKNTWSGQKLN